MRRVPGRCVALVTLAVVSASCSSGSPPAERAARSPKLVPATVSTTTVSTTTVAPVPTADTTTVPRTPTTTAAGVPGFADRVATITAADVSSSYHAGCPVGPAQLRALRMTYWGFDDQPHTGTLIVNAGVVDAVVGVFRALYDDRFPIHRMEPVDAFGGSDPASMAADNTSAFNCRNAVAPGPPHWSAHAYGEAIDVNTVENPYVEGSDVQPAAGVAFVDRSVHRPGMAYPGGVLVAAFASVGWPWGGRWSSPDYQHFSATGG